MYSDNSSEPISRDAEVDGISVGGYAELVSQKE
jgi:hypothetical protein